MMLQGEQQDLKLRITTFGRFQVELQGRLLSEETGRASRVWELFKYLVTHRGRDIPNDMLVENLWEDQWPKDPGRALRNLVYRLRQMLDAGDDLEIPYITLSGGFYRFNVASSYWLDTEEFEQMHAQAKGLSMTEPLESMRLYKGCLSVYKGEYLPSQVYADWVLPVRNYYRRLFLEAFLDYVSLLRMNDDLAAIGAVCEQALRVEPLEEAVHLQFIDYLLQKGKVKAAQSQYNYASSLFYREMGIKPSPDMVEAYRRICTQTKLPCQASAQNQLGQRGSDGSRYCEPEVFSRICKSAKEELRSTGTNMFVAGLQPKGISDDSVQESMEILSNILQETLRQGDTFCRWQPREFWLLLPVSDHARVEKIIKRIDECYQKQSSTQDEMLDFWYEPLQLVAEL